MSEDARRRPEDVREPFRSGRPERSGPASNSQRLRANLRCRGRLRASCQHEVRGVYACGRWVWRSRTDQADAGPRGRTASEERGQGRAVRPCQRQPRRGDLDRSDDDATIRASPEARAGDHDIDSEAAGAPLLLSLVVRAKRQSHPGSSRAPGCPVVRGCGSLVSRQEDRWGGAADLVAVAELCLDFLGEVNARRAQNATRSWSSCLWRCGPMKRSPSSFHACSRAMRLSESSPRQAACRSDGGTCGPQWPAGPGENGRSGSAASQMPLAPRSQSMRTRRRLTAKTIGTLSQYVTSS